MPPPPEQATAQATVIAPASAVATACWPALGEQGRQRAAEQHHQRPPAGHRRPAQRAQRRGGRGRVQLELAAAGLARPRAPDRLGDRQGGQRAEEERQGQRRQRQRRRRRRPRARRAVCAAQSSAIEPVSAMRAIRRAARARARNPATACAPGGGAILVMTM